MGDVSSIADFVLVVYTYSDSTNDIRLYRRNCFLLRFHHSSSSSSAAFLRLRYLANCLSTLLGPLSFLAKGFIIHRSKSARRRRCRGRTARRSSHGEHGSRMQRPRGQIRHLRQVRPRDSRHRSSPRLRRALVKCLPECAIVSFGDQVYLPFSSSSSVGSESEPSRSWMYVSQSCSSSSVMMR